jgi:Cu/Ag efflux protein CusF
VDSPKLNRFLLLKLLACVIGVGVLAAASPAQDAITSASAKPVEQVLGSITAVDPAAHSITVKEDKTGAERVVLLENTRTLLKVEPGAKDLKNATRIEAKDLAVGDRVSVRGTRAEDGSAGFPAKSVVLMSARDLQQAHQAEIAAWQNSTAGAVTTVDPSARTIGVTVKTPEGPKPVTVQAPAGTEFTRYSPETPKTPVSSQITDIQPGDQVRVIGEKSADGGTVTAQKIFSGAFRTVPGVITSISTDGKEITIKDLQTKQPLRVDLSSGATVRKLPPPIAMRLARRFNPSARPAAGTPAAASAPAPAAAPEQGGPGMHGPRNGDLAQLLESVPQISISDLKPGDAVVVSGANASDKSRLFATNIIAGVEPIFQSAPPRQGQSLGGDWSLDMAIPAE